MYRRPTHLTGFARASFHCRHSDHRTLRLEFIVDMDRRVIAPDDKIKPEWRSRQNDMISQVLEANVRQTAPKPSK